MGVTATPAPQPAHGPALMWLLPLARAHERWAVARPQAEVRAAVTAMPEQFLSLGGTACLQRNTWYRNPWKTWAMVRFAEAGGGTELRVLYMSNPATTLIVLLAAAITFATLPFGDAMLYVCTLGGVIALVGSFGRFVARDDVALLHVAIVRASGEAPGLGVAPKQ